MRDIDRTDKTRTVIGCGENLLKLASNFGIVLL